MSAAWDLYSPGLTADLTIATAGLEQMLDEDIRAGLVDKSFTLDRVVNDRLLKIGSSNLNNRSLGYDTECDLAIEARSGERRIEEAIAAFRCSLLAEHLGIASGEVAESCRRTGSLIATIQALHHSGRTLQPFEMPSINDAEAALADSQLLDPERPKSLWNLVRRASRYQGLRSLRRLKGRQCPQR